MTTAAAAERAALCDLFCELGPHAPTLCGGWDTRDLAAHLVVRERRPDGAIGIVAKPFAGYGERVRASEAERPWDELVERVRKGPPAWSPARVDMIDRATNTVEFFVHHEDVRRAQTQWTVRSLDPNLVADLTSVLRRMARFLLRKAPACVTLVLTDAPDGPLTIGGHAEGPHVTVTGPVGEVALFAHGRQDHARVELDGPEPAVAAVRTADLGI